MSSDREKKLEDALAQFLKPVKGIPFEVVVKSICNYEVLERFSTVVNRGGFPRGGFSASESVLVKEAGMDGSTIIVGFACPASGGDR